MKSFFILTNIAIKVKIGKGTSQRLRGKKQNSTRYTGIILDDFESELNTKTPDSRRQIKEWVTAAVYPAIDFDKT